MVNKIGMDDQPIRAGFFREGKWLSQWITPDDLEVETLHTELTEGVRSLDERLVNLWRWVAEQVKYKAFITGRLWIEGKSSTQTDLWMPPSMTKQVKIGNCANKAFLLASLVRHELPASQVYCVLGNLYNGTAGGHAWVQVNLGGKDFIMESTRSDIEPLIPVNSVDRYEPIHFFNDQQLYAVPDKTVLEPFAKCYSTWLRDYLDWSYINNGGTK